MDTKKLRQKILDLAIHGKLVPQDPNDEPASVLLERIRAEKEQLIKEGKLKKSRKTSSSSDTPHYEQVPFEVPQGWELVQMSEIFILNPKNIVPDDTDAGFIPMAFVEDGFSGLHTFEHRSWGQIKKGFSHFRNGDIGIAKISPCFENLKSCIFSSLPNEIGAGTTELVVLRSIGVYAPFYLYLCKSFWYIAQGTKYFKGVVGQQRVNKEIFTDLIVPLPPYQEQIRIANEIERWFKLIVELENSSANLHTAIKQTKSKILDLAIHGRLVPQDPNDEPAIELLKRINPDFTPCDNAHYPQLPKSWCLVQLQDLCSLYDGDKRSDQMLPYIDVKFLRGEKAAEMVTSGKFVKKGNFLILVDGENSGEVFLSSCDGYQGSTFKQLKINNNVYEEYVLLVIQMSRKMLRENKVGSAIPHLNKKIFRAIEVCLPPYQEQIRIVGEVAKLNRLLDTIMESL